MVLSKRQAVGVLASGAGVEQRLLEDKQHSPTVEDKGTKLVKDGKDEV